MTLIVCAGMSRSAGTLQYNLIRHLVEERGLGRGLGLYQKPMLKPARGQEIIVVKSERYYDDIMELPARPYIFATYRDIRDVTLSMFNFYYQRSLYRDETLPTWEEIVGRTKRSFSWYTQWVAQGAIRYKYEEYYPDRWYLMLMDMAKKMNISLDVDEALDICAEYSYQRNLERSRMLEGWIDLKGHLFTKGHFSANAGRVGAWWELLPKGIAREMTDHCHDWLLKDGYDVDI